MPQERLPPADHSPTVWDFSCLFGSPGLYVIDTHTRAGHEPKKGFYKYGHERTFEQAERESALCLKSLQFEVSRGALHHSTFVGVESLAGCYVSWCQEPRFVSEGEIQLTNYRSSIQEK